MTKSLPVINRDHSRQDLRIPDIAVPSFADRERVEPRAPLLLHVFPNFDIGGAQVRFTALAGGLGSRFEHAVISLQGNYAAAALLPEAAPVRLEAPLGQGSAIDRFRAYRAAVSRLKPAAVLTYNWGSMDFVLANLLRGAAHIHFEDGFGPDEAVRRLARRSLVRRLVLKGSHIVVPSRTLQAIADRDWRLNTQRVHYIPNGIAPMTSVRPACPSGLPLDLPLHLPRVIWAGALRPEKNPIRALHAFAALKDQAVLIVVGDGPLREPLQQEIDRLQLQDRVRLLGSRNDTRELIRQCDIMLVTSDTEQMPLVVLEAMDAGIPLVATDVGDIRFMVCEQNRPFVVPPTPLDLAEALNTLLAAHPLRRSIGQANRNRQRTVYHLDQMTEAYGRLFDDVLAGSAKRNGRDG